MAEILNDIISKYSVEDLQAKNAQSSELDKNAFLNLLVTQLKYQDPLDPLKNEEFIAQLAQFNSLEQMMNLNTSFDKMLLVQQLSQATGLIGQPVAYQNADGEFLAGIAQSVTVEDGVPMLQVGNDSVSVDNIVALGQATTSSILSQASYLIGKEVSWIDDTGGRQSGIVNTVEIDAGVPYLILSGDEGKVLGLSDIIAVSQPS